MIKKLAEKHGFSEEAIQHLVTALQRGNGTQAQFNHPELGGTGQWQNGMTMIGDAFNAPLKARVTAICDELAHAYRMNEKSIFSTLSTQTLQVTRWWDEALGYPDAVGAQNSIYYAIFNHQSRLVIRVSGDVTTYDTGHYRLTGISQQQSSNAQTLMFTSDSGQQLTFDDFTAID